jgi:hypothetical protein
MAAALQIYRSEPIVPAAWQSGAAKILELPEFAGVFRGRELTRKDRRLYSGLYLIDELIGGGIVRGRVSEITGIAGSGKTSLAASFIGTATRRGEVAAWIDAADVFDPESFAAADLARILWISCGKFGTDGNEVAANKRIRETRRKFKTPVAAELKVAEWLLAAGGLGLVVIDFGERSRALPQSSSLRLARAAERSGTAVIVLAAQRICGTFAALSLTLHRDRACFSRPSTNAPVLFDGMVIEARLARNKLGGSGGTATWKTAIDPLVCAEINRREREYVSQRMIGNVATL